MNSFPSSTDDPRLTAYAFGELEGAEREEIRRWINADPAAAGAVEALRATGELMQAALASESELVLLPDPETIEPTDSRRRVIPWVTGLGALAAALLIGGVILHSARRPVPTVPLARNAQAMSQPSEQEIASTSFAVTSKLPVDRPTPEPLLEAPPTKMIAGALARLPDVLPAVRGANQPALAFDGASGGSGNVPALASSRIAATSAPVELMNAKFARSSAAAGQTADTLAAEPAAYIAERNEKQWVYPDDPGFVIRAVPRSRVSRSPFSSGLAQPQLTWPPLWPDAKMPFSPDPLRQSLLPAAPIFGGNPEGVFKPDGVAFGDGLTTLLFDASKNQVLEKKPEFLNAAEHPLAGVPLTPRPSGYAEIVRSISAGHRPPKAAVRVEDCVNAFSYDYVDAVGDSPVGVKIEVAAAPWAPSHRLVWLALKAATNAPSPHFHVEFNPAHVASYRFLRSGLTPELAATLPITTGGRELTQGVTILIEIVPVTEVTTGPDQAAIGLRYRSGMTVSPRANELLAVRVSPGAAANGEQTFDFPQVDAGATFEQATADFKFAAAAGGFGMILGDVPQRGAMTFADVVRWASAGPSADADGKRAAFLAVVRQAEHLPQKN